MFKSRIFAVEKSCGSLVVYYAEVTMNFSVLSDMLVDNQSVSNLSDMSRGNYTLFPDISQNVSHFPDVSVRNFSLPPDMVFGEAHVIAIVAYSILFLIGVTTNAASLR